MSAPWRLSAREVVALLIRGAVSPMELLDAVESRCAAVNGPLNALPTFCFDRARDHARRLDGTAPSGRGPLSGLPVTIKDLTDVAGVRTTYGSAIYRDHVPAASDRLVKRIESRGGIVYAKSNTPEFGTGGITFNDVFGLTRSPRNMTCASGGSSGGAAAALASGCAWLSQGSDMAGSLRTPAAFCGVTSLRPSPGRISADSPLLPFDPLGQNGPMARDIDDLALFAGVLFDESPGEFALQDDTSVRPDRIAVSHDLGITQVSDEILSALDGFADTLSRAGCRIARAHPPLDHVHESFDALRAHAYAVSFEETLAGHPDVMKPEVEWNIRSGMDLDTERLRQAQRQQGGIVEAAARFMQDHDLLICPATSLLSVPAETRYPGHDAGIPIPEYYRWLAIAYATTMTALPVVTIPVALAEDGMPVAVQLVGRPAGEARLIQNARWIQRLLSWDPRPVDPC